MRNWFGLAMVLALVAAPVLASDGQCGCPMAVPAPAALPAEQAGAALLSQRVAEVRYELYLVDNTDSADSCRDGKWEELRNLERAYHRERVAERMMQKRVAEATVAAPTHVAKAAPPAADVTVVR